MKTQNQVRITNENARITESNVQHIGECIALSAIKKMMHFADHPKSLDKLYAGLVEDIYHSKGYNTTFSDGYDLASEVICFLLQMIYTCAIKEVQTKLDILSTEFNLKHKRNPISSIHTRLKRTESIMMKNNLLLTIDSIEKNIHNVAGIRVICSYIDDIYSIAEALLKQDDVTLIARKDYRENPKPNGYRSLHLIISIPVFLADTKKEVKVEVQIRTIAMDFWASLEHQMKYKQDIPNQSLVCDELKACADVIVETDRKMLKIREQIELAEDVPSEEEILFDRLRKLDMPIG